MACARHIDNPVVARLLGLLMVAALLCQNAKISINRTVNMSKRRINSPGGQRDRPYNFMLVQQLAYLKPPYDTLDKLLERLRKDAPASCMIRIQGKKRTSIYSCISLMGERLNPLPKS